MEAIVLDSGYSDGSNDVDSDTDISDGNDLVLDVILPSSDGEQAAKLQVHFYYSGGNRQH